MRFVCRSLIQPLGQRRLAVRFCTLVLIGTFAIGSSSAQNASSDGGKQWFAHVQYLAEATSPLQPARYERFSRGHNDALVIGPERYNPPVGMHIIRIPAESLDELLSRMNFGYPK